MQLQVLWWLHEVAAAQELLLSELRLSAQVWNQDPSASQSAEVGLVEPSLDF